MGLAASRRLARNPKLRMLMAAWTAFYIGNYAWFVLIIVYVFSVGGEGAVGAATALCMLPAGLLGPVAATLSTSTRPQLHLAIGIGVRCLMMLAVIAAVFTQASTGVVLVLIATDSLLSAAVRPLHGALAVRLADTAAEAAQAHAVTSLLVSASALAGPAIAGVALSLVDIGWSFAVPATAFAVGSAAALLIRVPRQYEAGGLASRGSVWSQLRVLGIGFRAIAVSRPAAVVTILFLVNVIVLGFWFAASALVASDLLQLGTGGVTTLMTLYGTGGLIGALATLSIVAKRGLAAVLAGAMLAMGVAFAALGAISVPVLGLALAAGFGAATASVYAIAPTLVQRSVARATMVPAVAGVQSLYLIGASVGALVAPFFVARIGLLTTLIAAGVLVSAITALAWPQLRRADALSADDVAKLAVIRATPTLAPLPALALEQLARGATRMTVPKGSDVVCQGDPGDRFYMIAAGLAAVTVDGRRVGTLGRGGSFGEIALLNDVPRSATVTASELLDLVAVDRAEFLGALLCDTGLVGRLGGVADRRLSTAPVEERLVEVDRDAVLAGRSVAELLATQPPLASVSTDALREMADAARVLMVPDGALIAREGDYGDTYYVVLDGEADVLEGEISVNRLRPGDGFGEDAILRDVPRAATVRALRDTTLVAVDRGAFERSVDADEG